MINMAGIIATIEYNRLERLRREQEEKEKREKEKNRGQGYFDSGSCAENQRFPHLNRGQGK